VASSSSPWMPLGQWSCLSFQWQNPLSFRWKLPRQLNQNRGLGISAQSWARNIPSTMFLFVCNPLQSIHFLGKGTPFFWGWHGMTMVPIALHSPCWRFVPPRARNQRIWGEGDRGRPWGWSTWPWQDGRTEEWAEVNQYGCQDDL